MNTPGNAEALLNAMISVEVVDLPERVRANETRVHDFYFNKVPVAGARVWPNASFQVLLLGKGSGEVSMKQIGSGQRAQPLVFLLSSTVRYFAKPISHKPPPGRGGLPMDVQGDMEVLKSFSANKFNSTWRTVHGGKDCNF